MLKAHHPKRQESLAEYYYRMNKQLLGKAKAAEYDPISNEFNVLTLLERQEPCNFSEELHFY